ncbi:MAG: MBL fold metallo-hydrolase [Syntrophales bacterium]|nr:MBL fold metallo-hydrolase [Syntrophales bacterium]MDX9923098.1 MBL fold metallo-hydrolase [Syntrophales bacterium]
MPENTTIRILVDNQAEKGLVAEHGFSLWIECDGRKILFDTGQSGALTTNARILDIDLATTDILVLSHGHYDHTGCLAPVLEQARGVHVYCHAEAIRPHYALRGGQARPIHMSRASLAALDRLPKSRLHLMRQPVELFSRIGITGTIPRDTYFEDAGGPFYLDPDGRRPDPVEDDMALWIRTGEGIVLCVGCAHAGLVNTVNHVQRTSNDGRIRAIIGGFHLVNASPHRLEQTVAALRSLNPDMIMPCHCTGEAAFTFLRDALGDSVREGGAGTYVEYQQ